MTFYKAKDCFKDNLQIIGSAKSNPLLWNLSVGLNQLAEALESDLGQIKHDLARITQDLQRQVGR